MCKMQRALQKRMQPHANEECGKEKKEGNGSGERKEEKTREKKENANLLKTP